MKPNPFLSIELGFYRAQISFTHVCLTQNLKEYRRKEFEQALGQDVREADVLNGSRLWDAVFFCPAPSGCCLDHTSVLLVEDEDKCRERWGRHFEETRYIAAPEDGVGPIYITDKCPSCRFVAMISPETPAPVERVSQPVFDPEHIRRSIVTEQPPGSIEISPGIFVDVPLAKFCGNGEDAELCDSCGDRRTWDGCGTKL